MRAGEALPTPLLFNPAEDGTDWAGHYAANDNVPRWLRLLPYLIPLGIILGFSLGLISNIEKHGSVLPPLSS